MTVAAMFVWVKRAPRGAGLDDEMLARLDGDLVEGRGGASLLPAATSKQCDNGEHRGHREIP